MAIEIKRGKCFDFLSYICGQMNIFFCFCLLSQGAQRKGRRIAATQEGKNIDGASANEENDDLGHKSGQVFGDGNRSELKKNKRMRNA
jgi:hypothetical protein